MLQAWTMLVIVGPIRHWGSYECLQCLCDENYNITTDNPDGKHFKTTLSLVCIYVMPTFHSVCKRVVRQCLQPLYCELGNGYIPSSLLQKVLVQRHARAQLTHN